jgi:RDD family
MDRKYLLNSPIQVARLSRLIAKGIDLFIALLPPIFFYPVGVFFSIGYFIVADSLQGGQSPGKRVVGMAVISLEDGRACTLKQSAIRNLPIYLPLVFALIPFWGLVITALLWPPLMGLELYLLHKLDSGHRLGDVMADTSVMANDGMQMATRSRKESWFAKDVQNAPTPTSTPKG